MTISVTKKPPTLLGADILASFVASTKEQANPGHAPRADLTTVDGYRLESD